MLLHKIHSKELQIVIQRVNRYLKSLSEITSKLGYHLRKSCKPYVSVSFSLKVSHCYPRAALDPGKVKVTLERESLDN